MVVTPKECEVPHPFNEINLAIFLWFAVSKPIPCQCIPLKCLGYIVLLDSATVHM